MQPWRKGGHRSRFDLCVLVAGDGLERGQVEAAAVFHHGHLRRALSRLGHLLAQPREGVPRRGPGQLCELPVLLRKFRGAVYRDCAVHGTAEVMRDRADVKVQRRVVHGHPNGRAPRGVVRLRGVVVGDGGLLEDVVVVVVDLGEALGEPLSHGRSDARLLQVVVHEVVVAGVRQRVCALEPARGHGAWDEDGVADARQNDAHLQSLRQGHHPRKEDAPAI
mmetsp:Transcript_21694/g.73525  ORF Transcript_21694/g.73525 Transcript_21694/m.73525 type:complete len:221 (+) Transcript_21694:637-1299(+)